VPAPPAFAFEVGAVVAVLDGDVLFAFVPVVPEAPLDASCAAIEMLSTLLHTPVRIQESFVFMAVFSEELRFISLTPLP
jgi:hypothetical protein